MRNSLFLIRVVKLMTNEWTPEHVMASPGDYLYFFREFDDGGRSTTKVNYSAHIMCAKIFSSKLEAEKAKQKEEYTTVTNVHRGIFLEIVEFEEK